MLRPAVLTYEGLPIRSGGTHQLRDTNRERVWERMSRFFDDFTEIRDEQISLILYAGDLLDAEFTGRAFQAASDEYGHPEKKRIPVTPNPGNEHTFRWTVPRDRINECLSLITRFEPIPAHGVLSWGLLLLRIQRNVHLRDPGSGEVFPYQGPEFYANWNTGWDRLGTSLVTLSLGRRSTCGLFVCFPFTERTAEVRDYIRRFEASLPFRLSKKTWSRWLLNKAGTGYYHRRISV
jgi:hypothetical protein